jgi:hypothetical protein
MMARVPVETIADVLVALDSIVDRSLTEASRFGYFAALYRGVTRRVKEGIASGRFEDGPRMERLDVVFALRYLDAYDAFRAAKAVPACWTIAFRACANPLPLILQHLLAGMNAHINFDLGIAAAEVAPDRDSLDSLKHDFDEINQVLAEEAFGVEKMLVEVSPMLKLLIGAELLDRNRIVNFDMGKARACAWQAAIGLVGDPAGRGVRTTVLDAATALLGNALLYPPPTLALKLAPVRAAERTDVRSAIEVLGGARPQGAAN